LRKRPKVPYPFFLAVLAVAVAFGTGASEAAADGSVCSSSAPQYCPAVAPTTLAATTITTTSATLNGSVNPQGVDTTCYFEYGTTNSYGQTTTTTDVGTGSTSTPVSVTVIGLASGTPYHFNIVCANAGVSGKGTDTTFATTAGAAGAPTVTTGTASSVTTASATLTGTVNADGSATVCAFQYGTSTSYGSNSAQSSDGNGTSVVDVDTVITGLTANTTYHYRLVCSNSAGVGFGSDETFVSTPTGSAIVVTLPASAVTSSTATLDGIVVPGDSAAACEFVYGTSTAYGAHTAAVSEAAGHTAVVATAPITGLSPATTYHAQLICASTSAYYGGVSYGGDVTFTTASTIYPPPPSGKTSKPKIGKVSKVAKSGRFTVKIKCLNATCVGTLKITAKVTTTNAKGKKKHKTLKVATKSYTIASGTTATLKLKLRGKARSAIKAHHRLKVKLKTKDSDGGSGSKSTTLKLKKK
jgi:hypothetical protein